jgi:hypothetical protein
MTTTADADWTNLPHKAAFVPLIHRAVAYLTRSGQASWILAPEEPISIGLDVNQLSSVAQVLRPDSRRDEVEPELTDEGARITYSDTAEPGFYEFRWRGQAEPFALYAVNVDTRESDLTGYTEAELQDLFADSPLKIISEDLPVAQVVRQGRQGRDLYRWFLGAVVALAVLETFLGRAFAPKS